MINRIAGLNSDQAAKTVSADIVNDAAEDATIEFSLGSTSAVFASVTAAISPPVTTVSANYTVSGESDPHFVTARAGEVESESTALALGGTPVNL